MRPSVSSPNETLRRGLKMRRAAEYFWPTSRCFIWWWNTVPNAWYYLSNNMIFEGEIKDTKTSSFSSDFHTLIKHNFPLYFRHELISVCESKIPNKALENFTHEWCVLQNCALPTWHLHEALILFWETREGHNHRLRCYGYSSVFLMLMFNDRNVMFIFYVIFHKKTSLAV